jgi:hypothetical protein
MLICWLGMGIRYVMIISFICHNDLIFALFLSPMREVGYVILFENKAVVKTEGDASSLLRHLIEKRSTVHKKHYNMVPLIGTFHLRRLFTQIAPPLSTQSHSHSPHFASVNFCLHFRNIHAKMYSIMAASTDVMRHESQGWKMTKNVLQKIRCAFTSAKTKYIQYIP